MPPTDLDTGRIKIGSAIAAVVLILGVQSAAFHQILSISDELHGVKAQIAVESGERAHTSAAIADIQRRLESVVTRDTVQATVQAQILSGRFLDQQEVDRRIRTLAPYVEERAMLMQRIERLESGLQELREQ